MSWGWEPRSPEQDRSAGGDTLRHRLGERDEPDRLGEETSAAGGGRDERAGRLAGEWDGNGSAGGDSCDCAMRCGRLGERRARRRGEKDESGRRRERARRASAGGRLVSGSYRARVRAGVGMEAAE